MSCKSPKKEPVLQSLHFLQFEAQKPIVLPILVHEQLALHVLFNSLEVGRAMVSFYANGLNEYMRIPILQLLLLLDDWTASPRWKEVNHLLRTSPFDISNVDEPIAKLCYMLVLSFF